MVLHHGSRRRRRIASREQHPFGQVRHPIASRSKANGQGRASRQGRVSRAATAVWPQQPSGRTNHPLAPAIRAPQPAARTIDPAAATATREHNSIGKAPADRGRRSACLHLPAPTERRRHRRNPRGSLADPVIKAAVVPRGHRHGGCWCARQAGSGSPPGRCRWRPAPVGADGAVRVGQAGTPC